MSRPGRKGELSEIAFLAVLLLIPPVYLASSAPLEQRDEAALERRIAHLESTAVQSPADLQAMYRKTREGLLPFLPTDPDCLGGQVEGIVVFAPKDFEGWQKALEPAELNGVTVYPVTVAEDPETRDTLFLSSQNEVIAAIAPEKDYDPAAWLAEWWPDLFWETTRPAEQAWYEAVYDPARVSVTYYLLPVADVGAMAEAQLAASFEREPPAMQPMMGEGMPEPATNLVFFAIESVSNGMALGIGWPDDFTNNLEVFARATIATTGWSVASSNLSTLGTNSLWWVDTTVDSNTVSRFYRVGNADLDSDEDGLTDARERLTWGTDENDQDSDDDGLSDYHEAIELHTAPNNDDTNKPAVTINFPANNGTWIWVP